MRRAAATALACASFACLAQPRDASEAGVKRTAVMRELQFRKEEPAGVAPGMNLDGFVSDSHDGRTCFKPDFTDPDGNPGIDNQLATLVPFIDLAGEGALQGLLQNAIDEGRMLVFFELTEKQDGSLHLEVRRGDDVPLLGTDGRLLSGQTLALHRNAYLGASDDVKRTGDSVEAGPFALSLPVVVFSKLYVLELPAAHVRFTIDEEGNFTRGVVAGAASLDQLIGIVRNAAQFGGDFEGLFGGAIRDAADMGRDPMTNECKDVSMGVTFEAVPAYIFE